MGELNGQCYGQARGALIILHGGAGGQDPRTAARVHRATRALQDIAAKAAALLESGTPALDVVVDCLKAMERDEQFNAGLGSALQADGQARLTAAIMDGDRQSFSGVISAQYAQHPSLLAQHLQQSSARVLTAPGTELLARELGLPVALTTTPEAVAKWAKRRAEGETFCDTVGCLVRTADGHLFAGTSTGGRGFEYPGRVSDSGTVAGTYCTKFAAISATGVGEEIVDDALAARLETRRRDGASLSAASRLCFEEATARKRSYGWIALDCDGNFAAVHTTPAMTYVVLGLEEGELAASPTA